MISLAQIAFLRRNLFVRLLLPFFALLLFGCSAGVDRTRLTKEQVLVLASQAASKEGYLLSQYVPGRIEYEYTKKDGTWTVFFKRPNPETVGGNFLVWVTDATGETKVMPGE